MYLPAVSLIWLDNFLRSSETATREDVTPYIIVWLFGMVKKWTTLTRILFGIISLKYSGIVSQSTLNVWNRLLYFNIKRTKSWNKTLCI